MAGTICTVIDPLDSGIANGKVFASRLDVLRSLSPSKSVAVRQADGREVVFKANSSASTASIKPYGVAPAASTGPGRTTWKVLDPCNSGLKAGQVFKSRAALVAAMAQYSKATVEDLATGRRYQPTVARATYTFRALASE